LQILGTVKLLAIWVSRILLIACTSMHFDFLSYLP